MISFSKTMMGYRGIGAYADSYGRRKIRKRDGELSRGQFVDPESPGLTLLDATKEGVEYDFMKKSYRINPWIRACIDKIIARNLNVDIYPQPIDFGRDAPKQASKKQKKRMEKIMRLFHMPNDQFETMSSLRTKFLLIDSIFSPVSGQKAVPRWAKRMRK